MKNIIRTYYREPTVDRTRILKGLAGLHRPDPSYWIKLVTTLLTVALFTAFASSLFELDLAFMPTVLSMYSALGGMAFLVCNLAVGICVFVVRHYFVLLLLSSLVILLQLKLLSIVSLRRE